MLILIDINDVEIFKINLFIVLFLCGVILLYTWTIVSYGMIFGVTIL